MEYFDDIADRYDDWYQTKIGALAYRIEADAMINLLKPYEGMTVLDVGCGTGIFSFTLAGHGVHVTGVDTSADMLKVAKIKISEQAISRSQIRFMRADATDLPFLPDTFDAVVSLTALEFMSDPRKMMEEALRVVKPQGKIVIGTIHSNSPWGRTYASGSDNTIYQHAVFKSKEELRSLLGADRPPEVLEEHLFIPPDVEPDQADMVLEQTLSQINEGGFLCAMWKKK